MMTPTLSILLVIPILDSVYELTACAHMTTRRYPMGYMRTSLVYEPICTVNNLYNDFIILQGSFLTWKLCFLFTILRGTWYYLQVTIIVLSSCLEPHDTTSARYLAHNVLRRHLVPSVGRR